MQNACLQDFQTILCEILYMVLVNLSSHLDHYTRNLIQVTIHDDAHNAFMTLLPYTGTNEGKARQPGSGPKPCLVGF